VGYVKAAIQKKNPQSPLNLPVISVGGIMYIDRYEPDLNFIEQLKFREEAKLNETFKKVFLPKYNLSQHILSEAKTRYNPNINEENHCVWECYGLTGSGKSNAMQAAIIAIHPSFKVSNIYFHNQQILDAMPDMERPDFIIRDENIEYAQYGSGSTRIRTQLEAITQTLRKRSISFVFIGTEPCGLTTTQYIFRAIDKDRKRRITRFAVIDPQSQNYLGAIYIKVMDEKDAFWITYNQRKEDFMQQIINMDFSQGKPKYQTLIDALIQELNIHIYTTKKERKVYISQRFSNLTSKEIEDLSTMLEIQLRQKSEEQNGEDTELNGAASNGKG
jgi:hypothetical protein